MTPIEEIYALLTRYEVRVPREETELLMDLRPNWRKLHKLSCDVSDTLAGLQARCMVCAWLSFPPSERAHPRRRASSATL
jgi:hypothetical protein